MLGIWKWDYLCVIMCTSATALLFIIKGMGSNENESRFEEVQKRVAPRLKKELNTRGLKLGSSVFIRVFKEEKNLEVWIKETPLRTYKFFKSYEICKFSGELGPKIKEGDSQAPEGFYFVNSSRMNPKSKFHLSFDLGFPNALERELGCTGSFLMIHGGCVSSGCYAMTNKQIEEIYILANASLAGGNTFFRVHCFPFKMTDERTARAKGFRWETFWINLKEGHDRFEQTKCLPDVNHENGHYTFQ